MTVPLDDRRPAPAKQRLLDALEALTMEQGFDTWTVGDLLKRAGVSRSSFYANFRDKEDLLLHGFEELGPPPQPASAGELPDFAAWLFAATDARQPEATMVMRGAARELVCRHMENTLVVLVRDALRQAARSGGAAAGPPDLEPAVRLYVGALMGLWQWWIDHDYPRPAAEMVSAFGRLSQSGMGPFLAGR